MPANRLGAGRRIIRPGLRGGAFVSVVKGTNPLFFLRLDEAVAVATTTVVDAMGNHNGAVVGNNITAQNPGAVANVDPGAKSFKWTGGSSYVDLATGTWMNVTNAASWMFWIYPFANGNNAGIFSRYGNSGGGGNDWLIWYNTGSQLVLALMQSGTAYNLALNMPQLNCWTCFHFTYDGTTIRGYANGIPVATAARTGTIDTNAGNIILGGYQNASFGITNHELDEVAFWNIVLTPDQILKMSNAGFGIR